MVFGTTQFICTKCGNDFESFMAEYQCTSLIAPMPCPQCGSIRTMPKGTFFDENIYSRIWLEMEKGAKGAADKFERNIKLAEQGDAEAQFEIGWEYESRLEPEKAMAWYRKAAEQGHVDAHLYLAHLYEEGDCIDQNKEEAVKWYQRAAELGDADAKRRLKQLVKQPTVLERIKRFFM